jgi:colanic acid biosynthesis glycosyl transferase WcaI
MKILVVTPHYLPDGGPSAPLYSMLCEALALRGHQVTLVAAVPHYPSGRVPLEYRGWRTRRTVENGIEVIRVPVPSVDRSRLLYRLLQFMVFQLGAARIVLFSQCDVVLLSNPALSTGIPLAIASVLRRRPIMYSIHDVYPNVGIALGVFRHPWVIAVVGACERFSLKRAKVVRILSESFLPGVRALGVSDDKVELIYDWVDTALVRPLPRNNSFAQEHNLVDKFVVLYAGNIGLSQGLEHVLTSADLLADQSDMRFVFVGDGAGKTRLMEDAQARNLANVLFLPFQPRSRLPEVLATADVSLVPLQHGIGAQSLPSKSFSILASGRPLIASVDEDSDLARLVQRSEAGICVLPEDPVRLAEALMKLFRDAELRARLGHNGRVYAERYHSPQSAADHFERLLTLAGGQLPGPSLTPAL